MKTIKSFAILLTVASLACGGVEIGDCHDLGSAPAGLLSMAPNRNGPTLAPANCECWNGQEWTPHTVCN